MAYVVTKPCIGTKDRSCVEVCPVECFYDYAKPELNAKYAVPAKKRKKGDVEEDDNGMLVIHPEICIHCSACEPECPVSAIVEDTNVPEDCKEFVEINRDATVPLSNDELDALRVTSK
jgi:NAD-dependent dihydropyrimidine dehydrogenase PreA subunit